MEDILDIVRLQAEEALLKLGAQGVVTIARVADSVLRQTAYWETPMQNDEKLVFVRFFSPVVQREEVFLGNILLNDFLSKAFARNIAASNLGAVESVANDLHSFYFLLRTTSSQSQMADAFRGAVQHSLPDLFFGEQDQSRGVYGSLETMLGFAKTNFEPFPVFVLPRVYSGRLEKAVRDSLLMKIQRSGFDRNPTSILANLAFFYCHNGAEMQSPAKFFGQLAIQHGVVSQDQLEKALNIPSSGFNEVLDFVDREQQFTDTQKTALKKLVQYVQESFTTRSRLGWIRLFFARTENGDWELDAGKPKEHKAVSRLVSKIPTGENRLEVQGTADTTSVSDDPIALRKAEKRKSEEFFNEIVKTVIADRLSDISVCSREDLREVLRACVERLGAKVDEEPDEWLMPFVRDKFLPHDKEAMTDVVLGGVSLGYEIFAASRNLLEPPCRVCGVRPMEAEDKSILMGQNTHRFHNQVGKQRSSGEPKICLRCAVCTYLMVKLLGSEAVGQPQVPKNYNLIFHYGKHDEGDVKHLTQLMDQIWDLIRTHQSQTRSVGEIRENLNKLKQRLEDSNAETRRTQLDEEVKSKQEELNQKLTEIAQTEGSLFEACPWLAGPISPSDSPSFDTLAVSKIGATRTERHTLGLGLGGYRLILFILPQLKPPSGKKGEPPPDPYHTQRRFSNSRITVTAMLSFLRELCGCDGPFYYQSLPTLTPESFHRDTFYVRNETISVKKAQNEYEVVTQLAWKLIWQRGSGGFVRKVVLAEKLLEDPMGTISSVMRDSKILGQTKGSYKTLPGSYREDWNAQDLTEYASFISRLSRLQEGN